MSTDLDRANHASYVHQNFRNRDLIEVKKYCRATQVAKPVKNLPAMQRTWVWSLCQGDILEKEMTTHSNILDWEIPWTEEPTGLHFIGLQRVGHGWLTNSTLLIEVFFRTAAPETWIKKCLNCVPPDYSMEEAIKAKAAKSQYDISCLPRIIIVAGKKWGFVLSKDWLESEMVAYL